MDSKAITNKLISGSLVRLTLLVCNIGVAFFIIPFLIHALGDRMYGVWVLVGRFIGYYGVLDLGLSSAVSRYMSRACGQNDFNEMNGVFNTSLVLFSFIGLVALAISFLILLTCPYFVRDPDEIILFKKIILILGLSLAIGFPARSFVGVLRSKLRHDLLAGVDFIKLCIRTGLIVYFIKAGYGILALAAITFVVELTGYGAYIWLAPREFAQLKFNLSVLDWKRVKILFKYSVSTLIVQLADLLRFKLDEFVIAGFLDVSLVTHYFIGTKLIDIFTQFMASALGMMAPVFSQFEGKNDMPAIRRAFLEVTKIGVILSVFVGTSLIIYGKVFIERWMGAGYYDSYYVLLILCIPMIIALAQGTSVGLLFGISKHHYFAIQSSCEGIANLILSLVLVRYYGIYGVALGTFIPLVIVKLFCQPVYVCRVIKVKLKEYYVDGILWPAIKTVLPILTYYSLVRDYLVPSYLNIFLITGFYVVLFIPVCYFFVLSSSQRQLIRKHVIRNKKEIPATIEIQKNSCSSFYSKDEI